MSLRAVAAGVAAAINLCLAVAAIARNRRITLYRTFAFTSFCLFVWNFFNIFYIATKVRHGLVGIPLAAPAQVVSQIILFQRLNSIGLVFLPTAVFHFALSLADRKDRINLSILKAAYVLSLLFLASLATPLFTSFQTVYWSRAYSSFLIPLVLYSLCLAFRKYRVSESAMERNRLRYLLSGGVIAVGGGITDLAGVFGIGIPPVGNITNAFYSVIVAIAIIRHRLLDIQVVFNRILSFVIMALLFSAIFALFFFLVGEPLQMIYLGVVLAASLILLIYQPLKEKVSLFTDRLVLRGKYGYQTTLKELSTAMTTTTEKDELVRLFVDTTARCMGIAKASLAIAEGRADDYRVVYSSGLTSEVDRMVFRPDDALVAWLQRGGNPLVREEVNRELRFGNLRPERRTELEGIADDLQRTKAEVSIPLRARDSLIGVLNLGAKEGNELYTGGDLEMLTVLSDEAALALENIRMWEDAKRVERLRALGEMAASVAHEVRNPLAAIRSSAQLLEAEAKDSELPGVILEEVDRLNSLVSDFLDFSRPLEPKLQPYYIVKSTEGALHLLEKQGSLENIKVTRAFSEDLPPVSVDPDQMKQVFLNLFLNAVQAMPAGGTLTVGINALNDHLEVEVRDTGCGIEQEKIDKIFEPFFTTKERGSGLGLSIVRTIVEAHRGTIRVESSLGEGTTITIRLPTEG